MAKKKKGKKISSRQSATLVDPRVDSWVKECDELLSLPAEIIDITPIIPHEMDKINDILKTSLKRYDICLKPGLSKLTRHSFFDSSKFTDFTIRTAEDDFKVYKVVVCGQSEYFTCIFDRNWKVYLTSVCYRIRGLQLITLRRLRKTLLIS